MSDDVDDLEARVAALEAAFAERMKAAHEDTEGPSSPALSRSEPLVRRALIPGYGSAGPLADDDHPRDRYDDWRRVTRAPDIPSGFKP